MLAFDLRASDQGPCAFSLFTWVSPSQMSAHFKEWLHSFILLTHSQILLTAQR